MREFLHGVFIGVCLFVIPLGVYIIRTGGF
jgi:hypothetical protein